MATAWSALVDHLEDPHYSRTLVDAIAREAARRGIVGVKVRGFGARPIQRAAEIAHALGGIGAWLVGLVAPGVAIVVALALLGSLLLRRVGLAGLGEGLPRVPAWSVLLKPPGPGTRRILAGVLDRAAPPRLELELVAGALGVEVLCLGLGAPWWVAPLPVVASALWALTAGWRAGKPDAAATIQALLDATVALADRQDISIVLSTGSAEAGAGVAALIDWWALRGVDVVLVGGPHAVAPLGRAGIPVSEVPPRVDTILAAFGGAP